MSASRVTQPTVPTAVRKRVPPACRPRPPAAGPSGREKTPSTTLTCLSPRSAMKSTAAIVPAIPSLFSVPVSQMNGGSGVCVEQPQRLDLRRRIATRRYGSPTCGLEQKNLYAEQEQEVAAESSARRGAYQVRSGRCRTDVRRRPGGRADVAPHAAMSSSWEADSRSRTWLDRRRPGAPRPHEQRLERGPARGTQVAVRWHYAAHDGRRRPRAAPEGCDWPTRSKRRDDDFCCQASRAAPKRNGEEIGERRHVGAGSGTRRRLRPRRSVHDWLSLGEGRRRSRGSCREEAVVAGVAVRENNRSQGVEKFAPWCLRPPGPSR